MIVWARVYVAPWVATCCAVVLPLALAGCAGEDTTRSVPALTTSPRRRPPQGAGTSARDGGDGGFFESESVARSGGGVESLPASPVADGGGAAVLAEPAYGTESAKPGDVHAFRFAALLRAVRANRSGAKVVTMLSLLPAVIDAKVRTGVDPFADGEWLLVYGSKVEVPGPNANVVRHSRADGEVSRAIADAGLEASDAGAGAVRADLYRVKEVLLRPQLQTMALVPTDRAADLGAALSKPIDPGLKPGELARIFVGEPAKVARFLPAAVVHATVIVKPAPDGGLDASADADCPDAATCKATAAAIDELVTRSNSIIVRFVLRNLLGGLVVRPDGTKLRAALHASPEQVDAALNILRAELGLPAADAVRDGGVVSRDSRDAGAE